MENRKYAQKDDCISLNSIQKYYLLFDTIRCIREFKNNTEKNERLASDRKRRERPSGREKRERVIEIIENEKKKIAYHEQLFISN